MGFDDLALFAGVELRVLYPLFMGARVFIV